MALSYLLDTNTCSHIIKGTVAKIRQRLMVVPIAEVGISVITEAELRFGVARLPSAPRLQKAVDELLIRLEIAPWDSDVAKVYALLRADLERRGAPMGNLDLMIAAHALASGTTLVTSDRVFRRVKGLKLEDWAR